MVDTPHVVIAGSGRVGHRVAERFADRGRAITVVDTDPDAVEAVESDHIEVIRGDAT